MDSAFKIIVLLGQKCMCALRSSSQHGMGPCNAAVPAGPLLWYHERVAAQYHAEFAFMKRTTD